MAVPFDRERLEVTGAGGTGTSRMGLQAGSFPFEPQRSPPAAAAAERTIRAFGGVAVVFLLAALSRALLGPWKVSVLDVTIVSVTGVDKPLSLAMLFGLAALARSARFVAAWRRGSPFAFYACATLAMWLLSLGPAPSLLGVKVLYLPPYRWLMMLPGLEALRVPARFGMLAVLCLAVAAAFAFVRLAPPTSLAPGPAPRVRFGGGVG